MQFRSVVCVALLWSSAIGSRSIDAKENPVMKIVRMLEDMQKQLQTEMQADKETYEALSCWCKTGREEKTKSIELAVSTISALESSISSGNAKVSELKARRAEAMAEIRKDTDTRATAEEMRMKESKAFQTESMELASAARAVGQSIMVLSKHHPDLAQLKSAVHVMQTSRVSELVIDSRVGGSRVGAEALAKFMNQAQAASAFVEIPGMQSYAPQSGQIFGILKQMKGQFEASLKTAQETEAQAQSEFDALKAAKNDEISAGKSEVVKCDSEMAAIAEKVAQQSKELDQTETALADDRVFLKNLQDKCANIDAEYDARTKSRMEEVSAVEETIKIINNDEAFAHFSKAASFLQFSSVLAGSTPEEKALRGKAAAMLQRAAAHFATPQLALIAASAQADVFAKVKEKIEKLKAALHKEFQDDIDKKDWCREQLHQNARNTNRAYDEQAALKSKKADLETEIASLGKKLEELDQETKMILPEMEKASQLRENENSEYIETMRDQRLTQQILGKAVKRLREVYAFIAAPHTQTSGTDTDPGNGPAKFSEMEQNAGGSKVLVMIEDIIADSKKVEAEAMAAEQDAQGAYEDYMKGSNKALKQNSEIHASTTEAKAKLEEELELTITDANSNMQELFSLNHQLKSLHQNCDFLLENFEVRAKARNEEIAAMEEAENVLNGMKSE